MKRLIGLLVLIWMLILGCTSSKKCEEVYTVVTDSQGNQWAGTKNGLYKRVASNELFRKMPLPSLTHHPFPAIYSLCCDTLNNRLWIGSWNHLYCYDLRKDRFITTYDSCIYQTVGLLCDSLGRVLALTQHGQYCFTLADSLPGGELTEQIDATRYPKPENARIDASSWLFEQQKEEGINSYGSLLVWGVACLGICAIIFFVLLLQKKKHTETPTVLNTLPMSEPPVSEISAPYPSFLERATKVIDAHIGDEDFSIDQLASELAVSRAQLFRKLKAAGGLTPKELIDERRMALASTLLTTTVRTITDIAWACGFSDVSNFRRAFIKQYGQSPSEYRVEKTTENLSE